MKHRLFRAILFFAIISMAIVAFTPAYARAVSGDVITKSSPALLDFVAAVKNGEAKTVRGVYVESLLSFPVIQQPDGNNGYVSNDAGVVTQYRSAAKYGTIGLLAHNNLAGINFSLLAKGQRIDIVYGNGRIIEYEVTSIYRYQALQPNSGTSPFVNQDDGKTYTAWDVFQLVYTGGDHVVFQTCIESDGILNWGRLFIIATPVQESDLVNSD